MIDYYGYITTMSWRATLALEELELPYRAHSIELGKGVSQLEFDVIGDGGRVHVRADGVPPQMFREGVGVVVEGTMSKAGYFEGHRLLVSHDNEYRVPEAGEEVDARRLMGTVSESQEGSSTP